MPDHDTPEHDGPVAQSEEHPRSKRQREGSSPSGSTNQPQANSAVCIARLLSTEGFTDYIGQQVKRYALRNATDHQRRSFLRTQRRFKRVMQKLDRDEKKIVGAFIRNLEGMGFDTGLRIGLTAYQRECQSEQRVGGSMEGHARPKGTDAGSSPAPHTTPFAMPTDHDTHDLDDYGNMPAKLEARYTLGTLGHQAAEVISKLIAGFRRAARERDELRRLIPKVCCNGADPNCYGPRGCLVRAQQADVTPGDVLLARAEKAEARVKELEIILSGVADSSTDEHARGFARAALAQKETR